MPIIAKIREVAENGYSLSLQHGESHSKDFFWKILCLLQEADATTTKSESLHRQHDKVEDKEGMLGVAYYLSEYGHEDIFPSYKLSQQDAIKKAASNLNIKPNTLKNQRDFFDSYTNSHREGWKAPLNPQQKDVLESMKALSRKECLAKVQNVLGL